MATPQGGHVLRRQVALLASLVAMVSACLPSEEPIPLQFEQLAQDAGGSNLTGNEDATYRVFQEESAWEAFQQHESRLAALDRIDFDSNVVLLVRLGTRPTGGYAIEVTSMQLRGTVVDVTVHVTQPPRGAMLTQALTCPYTLLRLALPQSAPRDEFSFRFHTRNGDALEPFAIQRQP